MGSREDTLAESTAERGILPKRPFEWEVSAATSREADEFFRAIADRSSDCIFMKDTSGRFTYVNPAMERCFSMPASGFLGKSDEDLFGEGVPFGLRRLETNVFRGQTVETDVAWLMNGSATSWRVFVQPMKDAAENIIGSCGIARTVTRETAGRPLPPADGEGWRSPLMRRIERMARTAAASRGIVLILGETGTGKDHLAQGIHRHSRRANGPFSAINCAALPRDLVETELFGHEAGAFTGANRTKKGLLELAEGGTLLLNEIGEMPPAVQAKLLSFLDTRMFRRVGGEKQIHVDARLIIATNRDLQAEVRRRRFRSDLFYRISVFTIEVPPLRERLEDLPILVARLTEQLARELDLQQPPHIDAATLKALGRYHWPGNIRELRNVLERTLMLGDNTTPEALVPTEDQTEDWTYSFDFPSTRSLDQILFDVKKSLITEALKRARGNKNEAARLLQMSRYALYRFLSGLNDDVRERTDLV